MISGAPNIYLSETLTEPVSECSFDEPLNVSFILFLATTPRSRIRWGASRIPLPAAEVSDHRPGTI